MKRRVGTIPIYDNGRLKRFHRVELPATGIDAVIERLSRLGARIDALAERVGVPPTPPQPQQRRPRQ